MGLKHPEVTRTFLENGVLFAQEKIVDEQPMFESAVFFYAREAGTLTPTISVKTPESSPINIPVSEKISAETRRQLCAIFGTNCTQERPIIPTKIRDEISSYVQDRGIPSDSSKLFTTFEA